VKRILTGLLWPF